MFPLALACYASFVWAALFFFRTGDAGASAGKLWVSALGVVAITWNAWAVWNAQWTGGAIQIAGIALCAVSLGMFWWAVSAVKDEPLDFAMSRRPPIRLIQHGPYRYWRHPFYASYTYCWLASSMMASEPILLSVAAVMGLIYIRAILLEEMQFLTTPLAPAYLQYRRKTALLVPSLL